MAEPARHQPSAVNRPQAETVQEPPTHRISGPTLVPDANRPNSKRLLGSETAHLKQKIAIAESLLALEAGIREPKTRAELQYFVVNEFHKAVGSEQVLLHAPARRHAAGKILAVKGLASPDPNAPTLRWLQDQIDLAIRTSAGVGKGRGAVARNCEGSFQYRLDGSSAPGGSFATPCLLTIPLRHPRTDACLGAVSHLTRRTLEPRFVNMAERQAKALESALVAFAPRRAGIPGRHRRILLLAALFLLAIAMMIPVPLRVLAPATVEPKQPLVVAAPLDGVIENIHVSPNEPVERGDALFTFNSVLLQNDFDMAEKRVAVAGSRYKRAGQEAFGAVDRRRDLAIAKAEYELAVAERDAAARRLERVIVRAESGGIALYSGKEDWLGTPVATGERIMRIADAQRMNFAIDLAVEDNIRFPQDARVSFFPDSDPLNPASGYLSAKSYAAELSADNRLVFRLKAEPDPAHAGRLRLGQKGTAQISGESVPLWYFLFRKPVSFLRQTLGL